MNREPRGRTLGDNNTHSKIHQVSRHDQALENGQVNRRILKVVLWLTKMKASIPTMLSDDSVRHHKICTVGS